MPKLLFSTIALFCLSLCNPISAQVDETLGDEQRNPLIAQADSLLKLSIYSLLDSDYEQAAARYTESLKKLKIYEKIYIKENKEYADLLEVIGEYNYYLGNFQEALRRETEVLNIREKLYGKEHQDYASSLSYIAVYNGRLGNFQEALRLETEALNIREKLYGKEHQDYAFSLSSIATYNAVLGNYQEAIRLETVALNIREKVLGKEHQDYASSLSSLAAYNANLGNYKEAIKLGTEALNIREKVLGKEHQDYAISLNNLAVYNANLGNYQEAIKLETEALNIREKVLGKEHQDYATSLSNIAKYNANLGNYQEAIRLGTEALYICEKVLGKEHPDYASSLSNLALYNSYLGNYQEAIKLGTEALNITGKVLGKEHQDYATSLSNIAAYNAYLGDYQEAIKLGTEALYIREKVLGKEHPDYATSLGNLAGYNAGLGNYKEAIKLETEALYIREKVLGKEHPNYATSLNNLALYNSYLGDYQEAIKLGTEALYIREKVLGKEHTDYATSLNNLAEYNANLGNYKEAIRLGTEALYIREKVLGKEHQDYASSLNNLANYNADLGNYQEAIKLGTEALYIWEKVLGKEHPDYASSLGNLATYNAGLGNYKEAIKLETEALYIREKVLGKEHPNYALSLSNLAICNLHTRDKQATNYYTIETSEALSSLIKRTFADLTATERSLFWKQYNDWFERSIHKASFILPSDSLTLNAYNGILLCKGLLLNSEIEFSKLIQESGDTIAVEMYDDLRLLRLQINRLMEKPKAERFANVDSLEMIAQTKESALVERSKVYGDYTKNLVITWEQVQEKLGDEDIAVEFVSFPLNADSTMYLAYTLKKGWECPKMTVLFEEKELMAIKKEDKYRSDAMSQLVWKPLEDEMKGVKNVYFAPSGELYNIAIESVPSHEDNGKSLVCDLGRIYYRLSSTRELALIKYRNNWSEAAVYGGLQYGMSIGGMIKEDGKYERKEGATRGDSTPYYYIVREDSTTRDDRGVVQGLKYLEGTKKEALSIKKDLDNKKVESQLFTDSIGTETSFKDLSGKRRSIIHIGTHGFFNDRKKEYKDDNIHLNSMEDRANTVEDDALTRSGLYFAGADNVREKGISAIPDSIDDGILKASEIAQLDLRGLDLVVLSACQTGLGEITGDGVFGLQRGFKKAGAQTIVMSLWKVDDEATTEFMTKFFKGIKLDKQGFPKNKHQAFRDAQNYLRENKEKFSDQDCWAAFVMLDGIE